MEAGMTQREVTKWYSLHLLKTLFVSETYSRGGLSEVNIKLHTISDKWNPRDEHFGQTGDRGGHKTDKMISVTRPGNNRVVYTNNKTVTLFLVQTYLDFFCLFCLKEKKKNYCTELNLCIIRLFTSTLRWSRKGGRGKKFKSLKPDCTEKRELKNCLFHLTKTKKYPKNK